MFAVDIASFSSRRDPAVQKYLRNQIHQITEDACHAAGITWELTDDRGDGLFAIAGPDVAIESLLGPFIWHFHSGVRDHNKVTNQTARLQLRIAVHAGYVHFDGHGATGVALNHLFRLLEAPTFKSLLTESGSELALIVSDYLYEEVIVHGPGTIDASVYQPVDVQVKETRDQAWVWLPPTRQHSLPRSSNPAPDNHDVQDITIALLALKEQITSAAPALQSGRRLAPILADGPDEEMMALAKNLFDGRSDRTEELAALLLVLDRLITLLSGKEPAT